MEMSCCTLELIYIYSTKMLSEIRGEGKLHRPEKAELQRLLSHFFENNLELKVLSSMIDERLFLLTQYNLIKTRESLFGMCFLYRNNS